MNWFQRNKKWLIITGIILVIALIVFIVYYVTKKTGGILKNGAKFAASYLKKFESFAPSAVWDVNAYRLGYGSDTITLNDGSFRKVEMNDTTTKENAEKDLTRRIEQEFVPKIKNKIGEDVYNKWGEKAQAAFISIAYNYGNIPKQAIVDATKTFDKKKLAEVWVTSTYNDNQSNPQFVDGLRKRRAEEAQMILDS